MKIKQIKSQYRRDFTATYECEFCDHTEDGSGYDDRNFYDNVIPDKKCGACGKSTKSENAPIDHRSTIIPPHATI